MHRALRWSAVALAGALVLSSCGSDSDSEKQDAAAGAQTITIWHYYTSDGQIAALEKQNELFTKTHPDVKFEVVQIPFEQLPQRLLATASTQRRAGHHPRQRRR